MFTVAMYPKDDANVWPLIGPLLTSRGMSKEMGSQSFSDGVYAWWVATLNGEVVGICALREWSGKQWEDCDYVVTGHRGKGVHSRLCEARDKFVNALPEKVQLNVCCHELRWKHYQTRGFQEKSRRGQWVYAVLS